MIKIYNTLTGKKDILKPRKNKINIFVCGPTVYDYSHIGHARTYIAFDAFVKYLRHKKYNVFYLQNITDLDDKIIGRARERGVRPNDLSEAFTKEHLKDMKSLGITSVNKYAPVTKYIKEIVSQIQRLQKKGFAYIIDKDGVYFNIAKCKDYGKLAGRTTLQAEDSISRIDYSAKKINRGDFCIWKFSSMDKEIEPSWKAVIGEGRPGWHIEDTAISEKFFGPQYDIHGGGIDLIFPHHEGEVSIMESVSGKKPFVKLWMHTGFLTINDQKMSKSLGNFITIKDFIKRCPAEYLRFLVLKNLWHSPMDYSESILIEVKGAVSKVEEFLRKIKTPISKSQSPRPKLHPSKTLKIIKQFKTDFYKELDDDFNTPKAFAVMFDFIKKTNEVLDKNGLSKTESKEIYNIFIEINKIFGFIDFKKINAVIPTEIKNLAKDREEARRNKDWQKSDQIRDAIEKRGFTVEDTASGPVVKII